MRLNVPAIVLLAAVSAYGCGGPPSREDAANLIRPSIAGRIQTSKISLGYRTSDREGRIPISNGRFCDFQKAMKVATDLSSAGHLVAPVFRRETMSGWAICGTKVMYEWSTAILPGGEQCCFRNVAADRDELPTADAIIAKAELVEVTGVTAPTEGIPPGPMVTAEFTYRWMPTDIGVILAENGHRLPSADNQRGNATFVRYDDGWRLQDLDL